jgi:hypothetical protein
MGRLRAIADWMVLAAIVTAGRLFMHTVDGAMVLLIANTTRTVFERS